MNKEATSGWTGLGILVYAVGVFTLSIYIDQSGILNNAPIYSVHSPIENIFISFMWLTLFLWVLIQAYGRESKTIEWSALLIYGVSVIGFAFIGVYFFGVLLLVLILYLFNKSGVRGVT